MQVLVSAAVSFLNELNNLACSFGILGQKETATKISLDGRYLC